jgi:hypothetical protein
VKKISKYLVVAFILIVASVLLRGLMNEIEARKAQANWPIKTQCRHLEDALQFYNEEYGSYPSEKDGLGSLLNDEECKKILVNTNLNDPWGTPFRYHAVGKNPDVESAGPDKKFDTSDDIHSY